LCGASRWTNPEVLPNKQYFQNKFWMERQKTAEGKEVNNKELFT